jgi:hypothetical protein
LDFNPPRDKPSLICLNHSPHMANFFIKATSLKSPVFRANATVLTAMSLCTASRTVDYALCWLERRFVL